MTIEIRYAWLQKHPSPVAARGEFHWYPAEGDRELRASFVERSRGVDAPAVLWQLAPGRVSWARVFAATAPTDGRRYVGLVLATAEEAGASAAELLEALEVPGAGPWTETGQWAEAGEATAAGSGARAAPAAGPAAAVLAAGSRAATAARAVPAVSPVAEVLAAESRTAGMGATAEVLPAKARAEAGARVEVEEAAVDRRLARARRWSARGAMRPADDDAELAGEAAGGGAQLAVIAGSARTGGRVDVEDGAVAAIARSLLGGGDTALAEPERADLPALAASVERWMPATVTARTRAGTWRAGAAPRAHDRVASLVAGAWRDPGSRAAQGWALLCELAAAKGRTVDEVAAELASIDQPAAALTDAERVVLGEARDFVATLHAWGRGRLDGIPSAATLPSRLADALALRVLACLIADQDPRGAIAEARWHALLPASRRAALLEGAMRRAASLRAFVEASHA